MIPKRVELENFLSFGTPAVEIVFADDEPLWVLGGPNGVGKSAVFDAMTYCLFGCHRGGKQDADQLVRHGANGFRVVFEFEFNGTDYRITRARSGKKTTQKVERRDPAGGGWGPVPGVNLSADVRGWSERTLGLGYEAFQASVLLRQGEADKIITAGPTDRGSILRKIIGAERYRDLGERVHEAAKRCKQELDTLQRQRDGLPDVTEADVEAARGVLATAEDKWEAAQRRAEDATVRKGAAGQWEKLDEKRRGLDQLLRGVEERAADEQRIRADKARLDELTAAVPVLRQFVELRDGLAAARRAIEERGEEARRVTAALTAKQLRAEIERDTELVEAADELAEFPTDLEEQLSKAKKKAGVVTETYGAAGQAKAGIAALLNQAKNQQRKFAAVGATCSLCGQPVSEAHARQERDRLDAAVWELEGKADAADVDEQKADEAKAEAEAELKRLDKLRQDRTTASRLFDERKRALTQLGATADVNELRLQLADKQALAKQHETTAADLARMDRATLEKRQQKIDGELKAGEQAITKDEGRLSTLNDHLSADWRACLDALDAGAVVALDAERRGLETAGVADRFRQLEQDATRREEWARQRNDLTRDIEAIPKASRVSAAVADRDAALARKAAEDADAARDAAGKAVGRLEHQAQERGKLVAAVAAAERRADLHKKLDALLGGEGLQRELIRSAEHEIVRFADDTVRKLSDGNLSVELKARSEKKDEALDLLFRRSDKPTPVGVDYLSGSQRFRAAVALALAIGRYAAGQDRPLESVIIDEGFGSLDRDGLSAMADELHRLRQFLKRIVLVSHQEEFADRFPVVIKLSHGETGTTAEPYRRG